MKTAIAVAAVAIVVALGEGMASADSIFVNAAATCDEPCPTPDGSQQAPYHTIAEALAAPVRGARVIHVAPGTYAIGSTPLRLPSRTRLLGSTRLARDPAGLAVGIEPPEADHATWLVGIDPLVPFIEIRSDDVLVAGFAFRGTGVTPLLRIDGGDHGAIRDIEIRDCLFEQGIARLQKASATLDGNLFRGGLGVAALVKGGFAATPAVVEFTRNRVTGYVLNGIHFDGEYGFLTSGASAAVYDIGYNDFSGNGSAGPNALPRFGTGLQFFIDDANDSNLGATQQIDSDMRAWVHDNTFSANHNYGVVVGGRLRSLQSTARARFTGTFTRNRYCGNGNNHGMFGFTFFARSLKYPSADHSLFPFGDPTGYLIALTRYFGKPTFDPAAPDGGSRYDVTIDDDLAGGLDYDNSELDPVTLQPLGNTLTVNGVGLSGISVTQTFNAPTPCP